MEEVPFVKFKRKRGAPLKYGPDKETSRKETARQRDATKVYLLSSHDEWRSAKQAYERKLRKPITNGEFALHLLSVHRKSRCSTCSPSEGRSEGDGESQVGGKETQTLCECACHCHVEENLEKVAPTRKRSRKPKQTKKMAAVSQAKPSSGRARRRKQSSPQGLLRKVDIKADPDPTFPPVASNGGTTLDGKDFYQSPTMISTTTKLLQELREGNEDAESVVITAVAAEEEEDQIRLFEEEGEDDLEEENAAGADSDTEYKPEVDEESKSSEVPEDSDEDYGKPVRKRKPRAKLKKAPPAARSAPRERVKRLSKKEKAQPVKRGPSMFIRRVSWSDLNKVYQCKICNYESDVPLQACRHLLAEHPEIVGALHEFLVKTKTSKQNEERSLYSIALEEPLPLPVNKPSEQQQDEDIARLPNSGEYAEKQMEARIQHFTDMLMPGGYLAPPAMPHLAGMPSFQQSFNRPPSLYDGAQNGMVPLPPHPLPPMTSATAIFGVPGIGIGLPEGAMAAPMSTASFVSGPNHQELHMTSPTTTASSDMIGLIPSSHVGGSSSHGSQGGGPRGTQENGDRIGVRLPEGPMAAPMSTASFVSGPNHQELHMTSPTTTASSDMIGLIPTSHVGGSSTHGSQGGGPRGTQENGDRIGVRLPEGPMTAPMSTASFVSGPNHQELHMTSPTTTASSDMIGLIPTSHVGGSSTHGSQGGGPPGTQENGDRIGVGLSEGPMVAPVSTASFVSGPNHQELHMTSPTTTASSDIVGLVPTSHVGGSSSHVSQGGGPRGTQENGDSNPNGGIPVPPPVTQSEEISRTDCFVDGNVPHRMNPPSSSHLVSEPSQPQSHSPVQPQTQGSSQPPPQEQSPPQPPITYKDEDQPPVLQTTEQDSEKKPQVEEDDKSEKLAEPEMEVDDNSNPFEKEELLLLLERWVKIPLECPFCNMKLPYMKRKDKHRCKRPGPSVLCDICGKSYPQTYFRFHYRRVHVPQKKVPCRYCNKEFKPSSLSKHILERHKPTRPYKCGICGKEFNSKKHCDKHEAVHKTEKPHKCPTCNRGFTQRTNMKNHMRQHTGEQPYRCHNCMKSFTHNVSLKNHLKRYHGIDLWQLGHTGGGRPKKE